MNYQSKIKQHLGTYKKEVLGIDEKGQYKHNGNEYYFDHILPKNQARKNILEQYRDAFFSSDFANITYHKYFHHLNSSQALCINLFYPLIHEQKLNLFLELLEIYGKVARTAEFEKISPVEQTSGRKTNFDFYLELTDGKQIFFEVKNTEQKFGKAKNDRRHTEKFETTYQPLLSSNPFILEEYKEITPFLENYQIMRNLVHIGDDSMVVFIYPEANQKIHEQALLAVDEMVTDKGRERIRILSLEVTIQHIIRDLKPGRIMDHFLEFEKKYHSL